MKNIIRTISVLAGLAVCTAVSAQDTFKVKVEVTDEGWVFDSGYYLSMSGGMFYPTYKEVMTPEFQVTVDGNIMSLAAGQ